jgi:hypothetical protein
MSDLQTMTYEVDDRIARITLDRPERGNGLTPTLIVELDPGPIEHPPPVATRVAARASEPHPLVQRGQHQDHITTVGVPNNPHSRALDALIGDQH